jgi:hypothetical protein
MAQTVHVEHLVSSGFFANMREHVICGISGLCREAAENCALLGCYAASGGNCTDVAAKSIGPIFRSQRVVIISHRHIRTTYRSYREGILESSRLRPDWLGPRHR